MNARTPPTRLVLLGHPVAHSLSPRFQNAALASGGFVQRYSACDVSADALGETLRVLSREGAGGNVTIPHKESVAVLADMRSPVADRVGAVNTFWFDDGALVGHNTDVAGVECALAALMPDVAMHDVTCCVLGAGGSAAAVLVALDALDARSIRLWSRSADRARALTDRVSVGAHTCVRAEDAVSGATLVINTTPVGLLDDEFVVAPEILDERASVLDLVYRNGETAWVHACRARGLRAHDGLRMLVEQGAAAFSAWFGTAPDRAAMWGVLEARA